MNELDSKIARLDAAQSEIPTPELENICSFIEKNKTTFPTEPPYHYLSKEEVGTRFPIRINNITHEIDIFLDLEKPFGQGQTRITMRSLQYYREEVVAVKILESKNSDSVGRFIHDIQHLQTLQHESGIPPIYEFTQTKLGGFDHLELILKFYNQGSLHQFCHQKAPNGKQALSILYQLLQVVANLHQKGFLFQDLSPDNCLIHLENGDALLGIADLEYLVPLDSITPATFEWHANERYAPPEFWKSACDLQTFFDIPRSHWQKIDMWGVGCCLWELLSEKPLPWMADHPLAPEEMLKLTTTYMTEPKEVESIEHLLWEMMREDPSQRIDAQEALKKLGLKN